MKYKIGDKVLYNQMFGFITNSPLSISSGYIIETLQVDEYIFGFRIDSKSGKDFVFSTHIIRKITDLEELMISI